MLDYLYDNDISNTVILAGDSHANWVSDLACTPPLLVFHALCLTPNIIRPERYDDVSHASMFVPQVGISSTDCRYDPTSGEGAIGVEFAGTAVTSTSSFGQGISPAKADLISQVLVAENADLQWSEGSYRGFFTLRVSAENLSATFYAMNDTSESDSIDFDKLRHDHLPQAMRISMALRALSSQSTPVETSWPVRLQVAAFLQAS